MRFHKILFTFSFSLLAFILSAQPPKGIHWSADGNAFYESNFQGIIKKELPSFDVSVVVSKEQLTPAGASSPLNVRNFFFSDDGAKILIYTNSKRVWRQDTRGDYWIYDLQKNTLKQVGKTLPVSSLMFAKFSPDANKVAYVSGHNIYAEDLNSGLIKQLTKDGTDRMINGTFDWVYEEEFDCRDGFRWSADGKNIAYWQIDATKIKNFLLIDNTDSIYSFTKPVEYPKVGEDPSACRIGVVDVNTAITKWMNIPGDQKQHYIPRMEWAANSSEIVVQQLVRAQDTSRIIYCNAKTGTANIVYTETDKAWIDTRSNWDGTATGWDWLQNGNAFLWESEKDGWHHLYIISRDGKTEKLITQGNYDVMHIELIDEKNGYVYFDASPENATKQYLYRVKLDGSGTMESLAPADEKGFHEYHISPNGMYAKHQFSNANTPEILDWVKLPENTELKKINNSHSMAQEAGAGPHVDFFKVTTDDNVTMDGYMIKPESFDSTKKYPVVFFVYSEPGAQTVIDKFGSAGNFLYPNIAKDGYIQISLDGRGTPAPKGVAWRKAIYKQVGIMNVHDQAMAARKIMQWPFVDTSRIAVWGWSGGGSTTLNLLFHYPDIYKTGIAIAPVAYRLSYDNIYEERYMGVPTDTATRNNYIRASAVTYAKNLQGNLLVVHGTGDDNVHYQNTEMLVNELVKYNKQFQMMSYPNRSHGLSEGAGTLQHLSTLYTDYLKAHCPPGAR
jgi:dipeptidyl-peptidase-4